MSPEIIGWLSIAGFLALLTTGMPVSVGLFVSAFIGYWAIRGIEPALAILGLIPYEEIAKYSFTVVPLFLIMGHFAFFAGFSKDIFSTARRWFGHLPGGLVQATLAGGAAFGAASGSTLASCAIFSKIAIPEMLNQGIDRKMAVGAVAAAGTLATMIPPSILMVIYGTIAQQSIGKLLIAGILPGLIAATCYMAMIFIRVKLAPNLAPTSERFTWKDRFSSLRGIWGIGLLAVIVMGGIYTGVFTPTEAGAVGAFGAFASALVLRKISWNSLLECLMQTTKTTGSVFLIIVAAFTFGYFMGITRIPVHTSEFLINIPVPPVIIIVGIMAFYVLLGTFMDMIAALFLTLPIFLPAIVKLGYDPIWFGVMMVFMMEVAQVSPPFGLNLFVIKGVVPEVPMAELFRAALPVLITQIFIMAIYIAFPQVALFLPSLMSTATP